MEAEQAHVHAVDAGQGGMGAAGSGSSGAAPKRNNGVAGFFISNRLNFAVLIAYLLIAFIIFWPITTGITNTVAGVGGDPYQSMWNLWWVGHALLSMHQSFWTTSLVFWPVGANLIYQTMMPIGALIVYPLQAIGPAFAYNALFFIGIMLSGFSMYILADYIVKNKYAAFVAGLAFTFSAFHIAQSYGHLDYANIELVPIALYMFLRIINRDYLRIRHGKYFTAVLFAALFVVTMFMGDIEQGIIVSLMLILIFVFYAASKSRAKVLNREFGALMLVFIFCAFVFGSWAFIPVITNYSNSTVNQLNDLYHNAIWSDDVLSFFLPSFYNGLLNGVAQSYVSIYHQDIGETTSYIGYTVLALAAYGIYKTRRPTYMWIALGVIFFLIALGPYIIIANYITPIPGPYLLLKAVPGFSVLREPGRFDMLVSVVMAILAAYGVKAILEKIHKHAARFGTIRNAMIAVTIIISVLILAETATPPLSGGLAANMTTVVNVSPFYKYLGTVNKNFSVLSLPALLNQNSTLSELYPGMDMFYTMFTNKPIIGGYLTRENTSQESTLYNIPLIIQSADLEAGGNLSYSSVINENYTNQTLLALYLYNTTVVTLNENAYTNTTLPEIGYYLEGIFGSPIYDRNNDTVIAWDTANAVNNAIFKSYVAFPNYLYWNASYSNSTGTALWVPVAGGLVLAYAPYLNNNYTGNYGVNTIITVRAVSLGEISELRVGLLTNSGISTIADLNISGPMKNYTFSTVLSPGINGNGLLFELDNQSLQNPAVGIGSIQFSLGKN
jgi:hypothetical protein